MKEIIRKSKFKINKLPHRTVLDKKEKDFSELFKMVSYKILIKKLEKYGIKHQYIDWLKSYLNFWKQYVSSSINKVIRSVLDFLFFYDEISQLQKSTKKH